MCISENVKNKNKIEHSKGFLEKFLFFVIIIGIIIILVM